MDALDLEVYDGNKFDNTVFIGPVDGFGSVPAIERNGPSRRLGYENRGLSGFSFREGRVPDRPAFAFRGTRYGRIGKLSVLGYAVRDTAYPKTDERYWGNDNQHSFAEVNDKTVGTEDPSSDNGFYDVWAGGFCQVLLNGADIIHNGDFTFGRDVNCENVKYLARSLGHQARSMLFERWIAADVWTCFSNIDTTTGQQGQFGGKVETLSLGGFIGRIFEFGGTPLLGPMQFDCTKAESLYRIGDWTGNGSSEGSLVFQTANLLFLPIKTLEYDVPANVMGGNNQSAVIFNSTDFAGSEVLSMMPADVRIRDGSRFTSILGISAPWQKAAWNASLGIYAGSTQHDVKATLYGNPDVHNVSTGEYRHGHIALPYWVERAHFSGTGIEINHSRPVFARPKADFTTTVDGLDVTLELDAGIDIPTPRAVGFYQGGAARCDVTGQILWIKGVIGRKVYAEAMSGHDFTTATVSDAGSWQFIAGGYKTPKAPLWGKFTSGSATISVEGSTEGLKVGDLLSVHQYGRGDFGDDPRIKEIHDSTIELEAPVGVSGELPLFVWIEEIEMQMGLGMGVGNSPSGSSLESNVAAAMARTGGVWYDPSDAATVFQERSSPSTTAGNGDLVGTIQDKNGTNHGVPATDGQRATLTVSGGVTYLDFDSANSCSYIFSNSVAFGTASAVFLGIRRQAAGTNLVRMMGDNGPGTFGMAWTTNLDAFLGGFGGGQRITEPLAGDTDWHVLGWTRDSVGNEATLRVDGVEIDSLGHTETGATYTPILGGSGGTGGANNILADVTQMIVMEDLPTADEIASIEAFITAKNGG
jgi:hypothetical protein